MPYKLHKLIKEEINLISDNDRGTIEMIQAKAKEIVGACRDLSLEYGNRSQVRIRSDSIGRLAGEIDEFCAASRPGFPFNRGVCLKVTVKMEAYMKEIGTFLEIQFEEVFTS